MKKFIFFALLIMLYGCHDEIEKFENILSGEDSKIWEEYKKVDSRYVYNGMIAFDSKKKEWNECELDKNDKEKLVEFKFDDVKWTNKTYKIQNKNGDLTLHYKTYNFKVMEVNNDSVHLRMNDVSYLFVPMKYPINKNECF